MFFLHSKWFKFILVLLGLLVFSLGISGLITLFNQNIPIPDAFLNSLLGIYIILVTLFYINTKAALKNHAYQVLDAILVANIGITIFFILMFYPDLIKLVVAGLALVCLCGALSKKEYYLPTNIFYASVGFVLLAATFLV